MLRCTVSKNIKNVHIIIFIIIINSLTTRFASLVTTYTMSEAENSYMSLHVSTDDVTSIWSSDL